MTQNTPPKGYELVTDVNERIQRGDLLWSDDASEWEEAGRAEIGKYASGYQAVARVSVSKPRRIMRSRRPSK